MKKNTKRKREEKKSHTEKKESNIWCPHEKSPMLNWGSSLWRKRKHQGFRQFIWQYLLWPWSLLRWGTKQTKVHFLTRSRLPINARSQKAQNQLFLSKTFPAGRSLWRPHAVTFPSQAISRRRERKEQEPLDQRAFHLRGLLIFLLLLSLSVLGTCQAHLGAVTNSTNKEVKVPWLHKPQLAMSATAHGWYWGLQHWSSSSTP